MLLFLLPEEDDEAYRQTKALFARYHPNVFRYAKKVLGDLHDAENATTDAFIRLLASLRRSPISDEPTLRTYLFGYAKMACLDILRKRKRTPGVVSVAHFFEDGSETGRDLDPADSRDTFADVADRETRTALLRELRALDPKAQEILMLKFFYGWKNTEIAERLGLSPTNVGTIVQRSLKKLRKRLEEYR